MRLSRWIQCPEISGSRRPNGPTQALRLTKSLRVPSDSLNFGMAVTSPLGMIMRSLQLAKGSFRYYKLYGVCRSLEGKRPAKRQGSVEVSVNLAVSGTSSTMALGGPTPIMGPGISNGANVNTPYIYRLFWSLMDYLLGKGDRWFSCAEWKDTRGVGIAEPGSPCNMLADDKSPVQTATK